MISLQCVIIMNKSNIVAAAAGLTLAVGGGLVYRGDFTTGSILLTIGFLNLIRFAQLSKKK